MAYYTSATRPPGLSGSLRYRAGATWIYAESFETYRQGLLAHLERMIAAMGDTVVATSQYLTTLVRNDQELRRYEKQYVYFLANVACREGRCEKIRSQTANDAVYSSYFTSANAPKVRLVLETALRLAATKGVVRFGTLAQLCFGGKRGSYYWTKSACEHLVYLGLASHEDRRSIRGVP